MHTWQEAARISDKEIYTQLNTSTKGLSEEEVICRLREGKNMMASTHATWWHILLRQLRSPFIYLLVFAAALSLFFGEQIDAALIILFICINTGLGFIQEYRSEHTTRLLESYLVPACRVIRNGQEVQIPREDLVPGDIVIVRPGDIVPGDMRLTNTSALLCNESVLTGESLAVMKQAHAIKADALYQATNVLFTGTTIVSGEGTGVVFATGAHTAIGSISTLASETKRESTFEKGIAKISGFILRLVVVTFFLIILLRLLIPGEETGAIDFIIFSIALAVSVIPEGLPLVMTFTFSQGAKKLAAQHVVVKRLSAIEDLGSIDILCTDKTGTLTENKLKRDHMFADDEEKVLVYACLASVAPTKGNSVDPFDDAIFHGLAEKEQKELQTYTKIAELPFDPVRRRNAVLVEGHTGNMIIVRGATEEVLSCCARMQKKQKDSILAFVADQGKKGNRTIAIAAASTEKTTLEHAHCEQGLRFIGCMSFIDPLKESSFGAIKKAKALRIQIKILTGDSKEVAAVVAMHAGVIDHDEQVMTGAEFDALPPEKQHDAVESVHVFARVSPEQKYAIISLLRERHEVGFLGEGINDAPALKIANVGIVVSNATDIAREASDIILLQKSLSVLIDGVEEGRRVFANNVKYLKATLGSNFGNFFAVVTASFLIPYLPMLPVQILLLNLLSDFPMIAIASDTVEREELRRPRHYDLRDIAVVALLLGVVSTVFDFLVFATFRGFGPAALQTNWFVASVLTELLFLFSIRTRRPFWKAKKPSGIVLGLTGAAAVVAVTIPFLPFGTTFFQFTPPTFMHMELIVFLLIAYFICTETLKIFYYRKFDTDSK